MGKYAFRAVKYFVKLLALLTLLFLFMMWSETSTLNFSNWHDFLASFFHGWRGWLFTVAVVVWCAIYPRVEFVTRHLDFDIREQRNAIVKAFRAGKMVLAAETDDWMMFRSESVGRRIWWLGDDVVTVTQNKKGGFDIEGPRRFTAEAEQRIPLYTENEDKN